MAHQALGISFAVFLAACGSSDPQVVAPTSSANAKAANPAENTGDPHAWGMIHSSRFDLSVPLPNAKSWVVDDKTRPEMVAVHKPTHSVLVAKTFMDADLVNRARCEQKSRDLGLVPNAMQSAQTIEDEIAAAPAEFDTRVWVAIRAGKKDSELVGDVFLFGAHVRKCVFVHYATIVPSDHDADELSDRLAAARLHMVHDISVDAIEAVPRDSR